MADREKVMRGLECCNNNQDCENCSYSGVGMCEYWLRYDALALLRDKELRVMTFDELHVDADESVICYIEFRDRDAINVTAPFRYEEDNLIQIPYIGTEYKNWVELNEYGVAWRCWTARPTDEQRKAVSWDERTKV